MGPSIARNVQVQERLALGDRRLYLVTAALVAGNVLLPFAFHQVPQGGRMFLPIFFFTLIAGWRFGVSAGMLTALLSPLAAHALSGSPASAALPSIILQSGLLGLLAAFAAALGRRTSLTFLALVVAAHQSLVLLPVLAASGPEAAAAALWLRLPGLLLQVLGGFLVLRLLERTRS
ncbi:MAG: hypothetical protein V9E94_07545 [Microthrixaceae bacterium]